MTTVLDIIKIGIEKEKESFSSLSRAANASASRKIKKSLNKLALEELNHILMFMDLAQISPVNPLEEIDLTFPHPDEELSGLDTEEEALRTCMSSELKSISLYMDLVDTVKDEEGDYVLRLLQQLVEEEEKHKKKLEEIMENRLADL